jgi:apolipoprotein N-acyltransferase
MRSALALLGGATLYGLAFPPFDLSALAWVALVPLLVVIRGRPIGAAFVDGTFAGCATAVVVGASWLVPALARFFASGLPVASLLASAYALLFWGLPFGLFAAGAAMILRARTPGTPFAVAALWVATELLRGRVIAQPWALLGYSQHAHLALIQVAALTGVYGVSFLLALASAAIADGVGLVRDGRRRQAFASLALPLPAILPLWVAGTVVLARGPAGGFAAHRVAIVQTNVEPAREWTRAYTDAQVVAHVRATNLLADARSPALVVWPENAVPRYLEEEPLLAAQLGGLAARLHADLLFGGPRYEAGRTYNSVRLITAAGRNGGAYDKQRLVLFAEHNPFTRDERAAPSENPRQFSAGDAPVILRTFVPLGVSVCHEILFPELVARSVVAGAALLVNVSNDGWLDGGQGVASRQHFTMAIFRAVETRRYLVRAATTGVSAIVDPFGVVVDSLPPGASGTLRATVAGRVGTTLYVRLGDFFALACVLVAAGVLYRRRSRRPVTAASPYPSLGPRPVVDPAFGRATPPR